MQAVMPQDAGTNSVLTGAIDSGAAAGASLLPRRVGKKRVSSPNCHAYTCATWGWPL